MDKWLKYFYGKENLPETAILCAGTTTEEMKEKILSGRKILHHKKDVQDYYLLDTEKGLRTVIFNIIGSPVIIDITHVLAQGGIKEAYFLSFAGTNKDYDIGNYFIPDKVRCLDGITQYYEPGIKYIDVEEKSRQKVEDLLQDRDYHVGISASVPSFFHDNSEVKATLANEGDISAIEMEASSALYFSRKNGIECSPLLIISDNNRTYIPDGFERRESSFYDVIMRLLDK